MDLLPNRRLGLQRHSIHVLHRLSGVPLSAAASLGLTTMTSDTTAFSPDDDNLWTVKKLAAFLGLSTLHRTVHVNQHPENSLQGTQHVSIAVGSSSRQRVDKGCQGSSSQTGCQGNAHAMSDQQFDSLTEEAAIHMAHKEPSEALRLLATATAIKPLDHGVHHNAGLALSALGLFDEAADAYRRALNIHAMNGRTWMKLGWSLLSTDKYADAMACFRMGSAMLPPDDLEMPIAVGTALVLSGDDNGALHFLSAAKQLAVNEPDEKVVIDVALGAILLRSGNWEEGWPLVENRWKLIPHGLPYNYKPIQPWVGDPEEIRGKRVVVLHEQGFGDTIQFARYLPLVQSLAAELTFVCPPQTMRRLMSTLGVHCAGSTDEVPYDILTGLMSLPVHLCLSTRRRTTTGILSCNLRQPRDRGSRE